MRLLITTDTVGGVWTYSGDLTRGMLDRGGAVMLVTVGRSPNAGQAAWLKDMRDRWPGSFETRHVDVPLEWMPEGADAYQQSEAMMLAICAAFRPDLLHCNQFCYGMLPLSGAGRAVPKIVAAHSDVLSWWRARYGEPMPESAWRTAYARQVEAGLSGADVVIAPTEASLTDLRESFRCDDTTRVILNGRTTACAAMSDERVIAGKRMQAMTCGRVWDEGKNVRLLDRVQALPMPVLVAGELSASDNAAMKADAMDDAGHVTMSGVVREVGPLAPADLEQMMRASAIYIVTSRYEPFGLAAVEAALAGCAIVASDLASQREVWGDDAVFFANDDARALEAVLAALANEPNTLRATAVRCRRRALARFSARRMVDDYAALYDELLSIHDAAAPAADRRGVCVA